jgi:hypothetical protein
MKPFEFKIDENVPDSFHTDFAHKMKAITDLHYKEASLKLEGDIMRAVHEVGISVDKERLVQALKDARAFFNEGYIAGMTDAKDTNVPSKWIPVTERLPERFVDVLCYFPEKDYGSPIMVDYNESTEEETACFASEFKWGKVTHWVPLPEPPKEVEG